MHTSKHDNIQVLHAWDSLQRLSGLPDHLLEWHDSDITEALPGVVSPLKTLQSATSWYSLYVEDLLSWTLY